MMGQRVPQRNMRTGNRHKHEMELRRKRFRFLLICIAAVAVVAVTVGFSVSAVKNRNQNKASMAASAEPAATPKPAPQIPPASEQNDLLKIAAEAQGTESKVCYLTFDDGPTTAVTPAILDTLKQYQVKATFFMLGKMVEENPDLAKRAYDEGHLLANHSYSHDYKALYATGESFMGEIEKTNGLIQGIIGEEPFKLIRFRAAATMPGTMPLKSSSTKPCCRKGLLLCGLECAERGCGELQPFRRPAVGETQGHRHAEKHCCADARRRREENHSGGVAVYHRISQGTGV